MNRPLFDRALVQLRTFYGPDAAFRPGQYEAVEAVLTHRRTLVIQRTGWGKSLVYYLCARLLARDGAGLTLVVSPLLALMDDQFQSARALGISCAMLCSTTRHLRTSILADARAGRYELLFVTPETLFSAGVQATLSALHVSLLVLDEAHCISDWGHDFRPDYGRLVQILHKLPHPPHILATTATADVQVIRDLRQQFGGFRTVLRGPLHRSGLSIQIVQMPSKTMRCAWILEQLPRLPGTGLIYCLSRHDCEEVAAFLRSEGIAALAYHSSVEDAAGVERAFRENRIRVLVSTIKLGLGYDKADIGFVIHFQCPASLSAYYQQIGRAGRGQEDARTILLCGEEEAGIHHRFREHAFPSPQELQRVFTQIRRQPGASVSELTSSSGMTADALTRTLRFLCAGGAVSTDGIRHIAHRRSLGAYLRHIRAVTSYREKSWEAMQAFTQSDGCLEQQLIASLGDRHAAPCGICARCRPEDALPAEVSAQAHQKALSFFSPLPETFTLGSHSRLFTGVTLCRRAQPGYARLAEQALLAQETSLPEELILGSTVVLRGLLTRCGIDAVCAVPEDARSEELAQRLAHAPNLRYVTLTPGTAITGRVLLVCACCARTDTLQSRAEALLASGAQAVLPYVLVDLRGKG